MIVRQYGIRFLKDNLQCNTSWVETAGSFLYLLSASKGIECLGVQID